MMSGTVLANDARTVQAHHHMQAADGHVVYDVVVGTLGKTGVYVAHGYESVLCHAGREGNGMPLGYAHVEAALGHLAHHDVHGAARWHGRCYAHDAFVPACHLQQCLAKDILIARRHIGGIAFDLFARFGVELARSMEYGGVVLGRLVAVPLLCVNVQQARTSHLLDALQGVDQRDDIVPVVRTEIANVHTLEHVLLVVYEGFDGVVQSHDAFLALVGKPSP